MLWHQKKANFSQWENMLLITALAFSLDTVVLSPDCW
jgi:hypothetical protein